MPKKKKKTIDELQRLQYEQTMQRALPKKAGAIAIMVTEDTYDKALTAFNIGVAAREVGMSVTIFFTARGINVLTKGFKPRRARWGEAPIGWKENVIKTRGGPLLGQLMYQAKDMGIRLCICYTSMISTGVKPHHLINGIDVLRMSEFMEICINADIQYVIG